MAVPQRPSLYPASSTRSSSSGSSMETNSIDGLDRAGRRALLRSETSGSIDITSSGAGSLRTSAASSRSGSADPPDKSVGRSGSGSQQVGSMKASYSQSGAIPTPRAYALQPAAAAPTPRKRSYHASSEPITVEEYTLPRPVATALQGLRDDTTDSEDGSMFAGDVEGPDDEACFLDWDAGCVDFLSELPTELALLVMAHMHSHLEVLIASQVSRTWFAVSMDNSVWRNLFYRNPTWALRPDAEHVLKRQAARNVRRVARQMARRRSEEQQQREHLQEMPETPIPTATRSLSSSPLAPLAPLANLAGIGFRIGLSQAASFASSTLALSLSPRSRARHLDDGTTSDLFSSPRASARRAKAIASAPRTPADDRLEFQFGPRVEAPLTISSEGQGDKYTMPGIHWYQLYKTRWYLDQRWKGTTTHPRQSSALSSDAAALTTLGGPLFDAEGATYPGDPERLAAPPPPPRRTPKSFAPTKRHLHGHLDSVYCVRYDNDRRGAPGGMGRLVSGSRDHTIKVWDVEHGACIFTLRGHRASVLCLEFDDEILVSGSSDSSIVLWDFRNARADKEMNMDALSALASVSVADGGEQRDEPLPLDDEADRLSGVARRGPRIIRRLHGHLEPVLDVAFDSHWIISCSKDTTVRVWKRSASEDGGGADAQLFRVYRNHVGPVNAGSLSGNNVVSASGDNAILLWDVTSGDTLRSFEGHERGLACVVLRAGFVVSGSNDHTVRVWDADDGTCHATLEGHEQLVRAVDFDPSRRIVVSGGYDKKVLLWSLDRPKRPALRLGGHSARVFDVRLTPTAVVSAGEDKRICIRDFTKGLGEECELFA